MSEAGDRFGKYQLLERLGQGGMAEVFLAVAPGLAGFSKQLVLKRVLPGLEGDAEQVEMFLDEARLAARLQHPNICQVFDLGAHDGRYFIVMEHVQGLTLHRVLESFRAMNELVPLDVGLRCIAQLLEALEYAHALKDEKGRPLNIVHRDVTPSNVMVTPQGSVKLLDFGIARASTRQHKTQVGFTKGKLGYMSPEQCVAQRLDNRSDLFAVGALLYVIATGRAPYDTKTPLAENYADMVHARFPKPSEVRGDVSPELERVILKAMAAEPQRRYRTAFDMLREVEAVAQRLGLSLGPNHLAQVVEQLSPAPATTADGSQTQARPMKLRPSGPPRPPPEALGQETRMAPLVTQAPDERARSGRAEGPVAPDVDATEHVPRAALEHARADTRVPLPDVNTVPENDAATRPALDQVPGRPAPRTTGMWVALALAGVAVVVIAAAAWKVTSREPEVELVTPEPVEAPPAEVVVAPSLPTDAPVAPPVPVEPPPLVEAPGLPPSVTPDMEPSVTPVVEPATTPKPVKRPTTATRAPTETLTVTSTPSAQVRLDGRVLGQTPLEVSLPEGTQRVELLYPGQPARRLLVNIVAGQRTPLTDTR